MSDEGEKRFEATPSRLRKARADGNVARSSEVSAVAAFCAAAAVVVAFVPLLGSALRPALNAAAYGRIDGAAYAVLGAYALLPVAAGALAAALVGFAQVGGVHIVAPTLKLERLNPLEGLKRIASRETVVQMLRALVAFAIAALALRPILLGALAAATRDANPTASAAGAWNGALAAMGATCAVGAAFALIDLALARRRWSARLRMTFEEFRRDMREQEGDPHTRGRRLAAHRSLSREAVARVREAAFLLVNPTHVAIALAYDPPREPVPRVLVRAADAAALRARQLAEECHIPVIENVALARILYVSARPGEVIPAEQFIAVAEVVCALIRSGALAG